MFIIPYARNGLVGSSLCQILVKFIMVDPKTLRDRFQAVRSKRESLMRLLEQPDLGTLRIDVNQALEELDDLIDDFDRTFPDNNEVN